MDKGEVWVDSRIDWSNPESEDFRKVIGNIWEDASLLKGNK